MSFARPLHKISSISALMRLLGQPEPLHPLVALIDYNNSNVDLSLAGDKFSLDFYKLSFKTTFHGQVKYGQGYYGFDEGGLAFLSPNQVVTMSAERASYEGYSLFFHPELIRNYSLHSAIGHYGFFSYSVSEALFLSRKEKTVIEGLFTNIAGELENNIDRFSQDILVSQLELLLNYSNRFYARQFITRKTVNSQLIAKLDSYLGQRFSNNANAGGIPSVQELALHLHVSPRYLSDMLRSSIGQNAQEYIHTRLIEKAKKILSNSNATVAEIAYELGFEHPQSFSKFFRKKTDSSPLTFRRSFN
jgi:AraC-like DNA-binding protein